MYIWVFKEGVDHPIKAELVARTKCELITPGVVHPYDYAMIHMEEDLRLPGLKIAEPDVLKMGEKVIFTGSTGGFAFFSRFGYITQLDKYFQEDYEGKLTLASWEKFPYWTVYPGGPGDSGGPVTNIKAEIVTIMYCGVTNYSEEYIFGNPTQIIWDFLKEFKLEHLAR
jgi:S1-C subfamily serine protease